MSIRFGLKTGCDIAQHGTTNPTRHDEVANPIEPEAANPTCPKAAEPMQPRVVNPAHLGGMVNPVQG
jgi:hypothetical protein